MSISVEQNNPIRVSGTTSSSEIISTKREFIRRVVWHNPNVAGDLVVLKDGHGNYIVELKCEENNKSQTIDIGDYFDGIYCHDMDSGTLYIYVRYGI